jgi:protein-tyrosine-phosphatase
MSRKRKADNPSLLFVCTANICRSPMAQGLMAVIAREHDPAWRSWHIRSAGIRALDGLPASQDAIETMRSRGIDITDHRSHSVTRGDVQSCQVIIAMEERQKRILQEQFTEAKERIFTVGEIVESDQDVVDPFGGTLQDYEITARLLEKWLEDAYVRIHYLASGGSRHYLHRIKKQT